MKRVLIVGCPGSGKSTLARALRDRTGLPLYYLDQIWHRPDGTHISPEAFDARLFSILSQEQWILDGNYLRTLPQRLQRCDTVFWLDYPCSVCLEGAARVSENRGKICRGWKKNLILNSGNGLKTLQKTRGPL